MRLFLLWLPLLATAAFAQRDIGPTGAVNTQPPNSLNVKKSCGAKGDGSTDDSFFIQRCINKAKPGRTVFFPNGTYLLMKTINVKGGITYMGESTNAVLRSAEMGNWIFMFPDSQGNQITITSLTFESGGINTLGNSEFPKRVRITNCKFQNMTQLEGNWQQKNFIYADNGLSSSQIDHNSFSMLLGNGMTRHQNTPDYDGDLPRSAIWAYGLDNTSIDHNTFDRVYQGIKVCQTYPFQARNVYIGWNVMTRIHRMGMEIQDAPGCGRQNPPGVTINTKDVTIEHNSITNWDDYYWSSFGISWANASSENVTIRNNVIIGSEYYKAPGVPSDTPGMGIEVGGQPALVYNNTLRGPWGQAIAVFGGSQNSDVHNNFACNVNVHAGAPQMADEHGGTNTRYHDNTTVYPCPPETKAASK